MDNIGQAVWFDLYADDVDRAVEFYSKVLGWQCEKMDIGGMPYTVIRAANGKSIGGIAKRNGLPAPQGTSPNTVVAIQVENMDECLQRVADAGRPLAMSAIPIPGDDAYAAFFDTEDNVIGVIAPVSTASGLEPQAVEA